MRIGGIHYKGEDAIRAYKNGVMIWHLVDFTFCSCEGIELFTLPFVSFYSSDTWNLAEKQSIPIDLLEFHSLYASQDKNMKSSWSGIQKISRDSLKVSDSGNSIGEKTIDLIESITGYASSSINNKGTKDIKSLSNVIGYASLAEQMLPDGPMKMALFMPAYLQPSQTMRPKGEQFLTHCLPLLNRPSRRAIPDGWILSKIYFPLMVQWSEAYYGTSLIKDNIIAPLVLDERALVQLQQNILHSNKTLMQISPTEEVEVLYNLLTKLRDFLVVDESQEMQKYFVIQDKRYSYVDLTEPKGVQKIFVIQDKRYSYVDLAESKGVQKNNIILSFLNTRFDLAQTMNQKVDKEIKTSERISIQLPFSGNAEIYKSINGYSKLLLENGYASAYSFFTKTEVKNVNLLRLTEALDYNIFIFERVLNKNYLFNSKNENMFTRWLIYPTDELALDLSYSQQAKYLLEIFSFSLKTLFEFGKTVNSQIQYSTIGLARSVLNKDFGLDNFARYQGKGKSSSIFRADERIRYLSQETIKSLSSSQFRTEELKPWNPEILIKFISDSIFRNNEPIVAKYTKSKNTFLFLPYLDFIETFEGFLTQSVDFCGRGFLEQNSGLLFLSGLSNNYLKTEVNELTLREQVVLIPQEETRHSEGYMFLSFIEAFTGLKENFTSKGKIYFEQWDAENLKQLNSILYRSYAMVEFTVLQKLKQFVAYSTHDYVIYLQNTELLLFGNSVSINNHFSLLNLVLKQSTSFEENLLNFFSAAKTFITPSFSQAESGNNEIKNAYNSILSFDENYRWLYPYYLDNEGTELFIYQVKNFSYEDKSFI